MVTWADILWAHKCTACGWTFRAPEFGLNRAVCPKCTAELPDRIALHLDRAIRGSWFLSWWRIACRQLRHLTPEHVREFQAVWNRGSALRKKKGARSARPKQKAS